MVKIFTPEGNDILNIMIQNEQHTFGLIWQGSRDGSKFYELYPDRDHRQGAFFFERKRGGGIGIVGRNILRGEYFFTTKKGGEEFSGNNKKPPPPTGVRFAYDHG